MFKARLTYHDPSKANRIEVWRPTAEGLTCLHTRVVYGTIAMMQQLDPKDSETELLFVGTNRQQYFTLAWDPKTRRLESTLEQHIFDDAEQYMRESQSQNQCLVDPTGQYMAMHLWEGVINVFNLKTGRGQEKTRLKHMATVRLNELWIKSSAFIHDQTRQKPQIAFLYKTRLDQEDARIAVYQLTRDGGKDIGRFDPLRDRELDQVIADPFASMLISVPIPEDDGRRSSRRTAEPLLGGLLVVGETLITYYDSATFGKTSTAEPLKQTAVLAEPKIYVAWAPYDDTRYLLADDFGRLDLLTIETVSTTTGTVVKGISVDPMKFDDETKGPIPASTSRASKLVNLGNDTLFVASHHGDGEIYTLDISTRQLVKIQDHSNNAPILDFAIMDMGNREGDPETANAYSSGQARIVAGCGAYKDGSLRSIRSGVGLEDHGVLDEIEGTRGLFTLRSHGAELVDMLVISLIKETRIFKFGPEGDIEELYDVPGMSLDAETLVAANLPNGLLLHVTPESAKLIDMESGVTNAQWFVEHGKTITAASSNGKWALLSVDGTTLVSLNLLDDLAAQVQKTSHNTNDGIPDQISCLHAAHTPEDLGVVGWWSSGTISVVDMATLNPIHGETLRQTDDSAAVPRDIALVQLHPSDTSGPTLLVATEEGNVVTFNVEVREFQVSGRKTVTLGSSPARLHLLPQDDGTCNIFATTEHSSLIYGHEGRVIFSATTADDATFVAPFNSEAYPNAIILSTNENVKLSEIDQQRTTHVKSLHFGETVRRVAYSSDLKAFGVGAIKKELINNEEIVTSSFRLVDEIVFKELGEPFQLEATNGIELAECLIRASLPDSNGNHSERFILGTSFTPDSELQVADKTRGRIIVLGVDEDRKPYQIVNFKIKGMCKCLGVIGDTIIAGLSKTVVALRYVEDTSTTGELEKVAAYRPSSMPISLDIQGNMIGVADLMTSLALVEYTPPSGTAPAKLEERARHLSPMWSTAVSSLGDNQWLMGDAQGNLVVIKRNTEAPTAQDQARLDIISALNLGEQINCIRRLYIAPHEMPIVLPKAFLGSVSQIR